MAFTRIDDKVYNEAKKRVKKHSLEYPTLSNYVSVAVDKQNKDVQQ
jgi:hypothetical protein